MRVSSWGLVRRRASPGVAGRGSCRQLFMVRGGSLGQWGLHVLRGVSQEGGGVRRDQGGLLTPGEGVRPLGGYPGRSVGVEVRQEAWGAWLTPVWEGQWGSTSGWGWGKRPEGPGLGGGNGDGIKTGGGSVVRKFRVGRETWREG